MQKESQRLLSGRTAGIGGVGNLGQNSSSRQLCDLGQMSSLLRASHFSAKKREIIAKP